ncbi:cytochrome P450 [Streptomyces globosus]|uniref:cytochrome P450 n=1 Tax=Streptomyces globosus TaxID=68209 RepID=UPI0031D9F02E
MTGPATTRAVAARGQRGPSPRAGRAESVRFAATRALPFFVRSVPGTRPAFPAEALRELRDRHGGAPVLVHGMSGPVLVLLDRREMRQFYDSTGAAAPGGAAPALPPAEALRTVLAEEVRPLASGTTLELVRLRQAVARAARRLAPAAGSGRAAPPEGPAGASGLLGRLLRRHGRQDPGPARGTRPERHPHPGPRCPAHPWAPVLDSVPATVLRTLLLLGAHPAEQAAAAAAAAARSDPHAPARLQACVREALRLYPAVPDLVRTTRTETVWRGVHHPAGTRVLLPVHFHQRDAEHVPAAHVFVPGRWKTPGAEEDLRMAPFGHGSGRCPGERLGLLITTALCAEVLRRSRITGIRPVLDPHGPLPAVLDPRGIRLTLTRR